MIRFRIFVMTLCLMAGFACSAFGTLTLRYEGIADGQETQSDLDNQDYGQLHLFTDVIDLGQDQLLFRFRNTDPAATSSSITRVYFDDDVFETGSSLLSSPILDDSSPGVDFEIDSQQLPPRGQNLTPPWDNSDTDFSASAVPPTYHNGVNSPTEYLDILFNANYSEVESALQQGNLRIALHVQSFPDNGNSMAFVNVPVPEPSILLLMSMGSLILTKRKRVA